MSEVPTYYLRDRNRVTGPFNLDQLQAMKRRGRLARFHQLSVDRLNWVGADSIPELYKSVGVSRNQVDTSAEGSGRSVMTAEVSEPQHQAETRQGWFYASQEKSHGPIDLDELRRLVSTGELFPTVLVWRNGLDSWRPAADLPEFAGLGVGAISVQQSAQPPLPTRTDHHRWKMMIPWVIGVSGLLAIAIVSAVLMFRNGLGSLSGDRVVREHVDQERIRGAVGLVVSGWTLTYKDGNVRDLTEGTGSCFAVSPDGYLLTNQHVVASAAPRFRMAKDYIVEDFIRAAFINPHLDEIVEEAVGNIRGRGDATTENTLVPEVAMIMDKRIAVIEPQVRREVATISPKVWVFIGDQTPLESEVVHVSERYDMAILRVARSKGPYFHLAPGSRMPERGQRVYAVGFPGSAMHAVSEEELSLSNKSETSRVQYRFRPRDFEYTLTDGIVSKLSTEQVGRHWIQHTASISQGNSGGPLIDEKGRVLAVNTLLTKGEEDVGATIYSLSLPQMMAEIVSHVPNISR